MPVTIGNLRATWANSEITYTGIGMNVNATSYNANSSLLDLKLNSNTVLKVASNGVLYVNGVSIVATIDAGLTLVNANVANTLANTSGASFNGNLNFPKGNVGIGLSNPTSNLHVVGTANITGNLYVTSSLNVAGIDIVSALSAESVNVQTFTASGTWYKPAIGSMIRIQLWGAGGSGAARQTLGSNGATLSSSSGGGGGAYREYIFTVSDFGSTETVTVGAGGTAVTANNNGNAGGSTSFGSLNAAAGGEAGNQKRNHAGIAIIASEIQGKGGNNPEYFSMTPHFVGSNGAAIGITFLCSIVTFNYANTANTFYAAGGGGAIAQGGTLASTMSISRRSVSILGGNGGEQGNTSNGVSGSEPGGGGGAAFSANTYVVTSGAGANGKAIITVW